MSEELVNQLTLNFLISKNQLQKLNRKMKEDNVENKQTILLEWKDRLNILFNSLLVNQPPDDLLYEVKTSFDTFVDKSIYYFKAHDNSIELENDRNNDTIRDDIDYEKEEREIEKGNYKEKVEEDAEDEEDEEEAEEDLKEALEDAEEDLKEDTEVKDALEDAEEALEDAEVKEALEEVVVEKPNSYYEKNTSFLHEPVIVKKKYTKKTNSIGVDDIQKLPLNWFQTVRQNYKKNNIIPRKKDL